MNLSKMGLNQNHWIHDQPRQKQAIQSIKATAINNIKFVTENIQCAILSITSICCRFRLHIIVTMATRPNAHATN